MKPSLLTTLLFALFAFAGYGQTTVYGCTDPQALNYDPNANEDGGNCCYTNYLSSDAQIGHVYFISFYTVGFYEFLYVMEGGLTGLCVPEGCIQMQVYPGGLGHTDLTFYLNGEALTTFTAQELNESEGIISISIGNTIQGCIDQFACNYNPQATCNDGSCVYDCFGCTDPSAFNYDPTATVDDGSCCDAENYITVTTQVDQPEFLNYTIYSNQGGFYYYSYYGPSFCVPDGCYEIQISYDGGMTAGEAYPITITNANGDVLLSSTFSNYEYTVLPLSVNSQEGCGDVYACNYNPASTCFIDCDYSCYGCTDPNADNFNPQATIDDGSCCSGQYSIVSESNIPFSWFIQSANTYASGTYPEQSAACLPDGCLTMYIYPNTDLPVIELPVSIVDANGNQVFSTVTSGWGSSFIVSLNAISGCNDPNACNFDPTVNCSDYLACVYDCFGCTDENAPNYNPEAIFDDGSCCTGDWYTLSTSVEGQWNAYSTTTQNGGQLPFTNGFCAPEGCIFIEFYPLDYNNTDFTLEVMLNGEVVASGSYDPNYGGVFIEISNGAVYGCLDTYACNYDPEATCPDYNSCTYDCYGCTDSEAVNYDADATLDNGMCCFNSWYTVEMSAPAYWYTSSLVDFNYGYGTYPEQNGFCVDGACFQFYAWSYDGQPLTYTILDQDGNEVASGEIDGYYGEVVTVSGEGFITGCGDINACNYNPNANCYDYYSCDYSCYGCTDPDAPNYDPQATIDNGSCCTSDWYTVNMTEEAYWYVYDTQLISSGGIFPDQNGFCSNSSCMTLVVYPFGSNPVEYTISDANGTIIHSGTVYPYSYELESISFTGEIAGCTDPGACNYNPEATCESGACNYYCGGCTDESAMNYDANAQYDDGTCFYAAVPPMMGMAMLPDEENNQYYVVLNMTDAGNGAPYLLSSDYGVQMMLNEAGEYVAGPFPCDAEIEFTLQSLPAGMATYMNTSMEMACAITSSADEVSLEPSGFLIYPNPNNGMFTISGINASQATLRILDMSGRLVREQQLNGGDQISVNTEELNNGVYQVSIITANGIQTERMVVKK